MTLLQPPDLALRWPDHAEDQFAELFARALRCNKAAVWLQEERQPKGVLRPVGMYGLKAAELPVLMQARLHLQEEALGRRAQQEEMVQLVWSRDRAQMGATEQALMEAYHLDTLYCCALRLPDDTLGLIYSASEEPQEPDMGRIIQAAQVAQSLTIGLHRQLLQEKAVQVEKRLAQILDRTPDMIITRTGFTINTVNRACQDILGYTPEEMIGRPLTDFLHPEDLPRTSKMNDIILQGQMVRDYRNRYLHKNGSVVHLSWNTSDEGGGNIISIARDITHQVRQEKLLRESEERFKTMADSAPVLVWMSDLSKGYYFFNQVWLDFTGRTHEQEYGNGWAEGVHPEDLQRCLEIYLGHFDQQKEFEMEYRLRRHDGVYRWLLDRGVPRYGIDGEFVGFTGACIDIHDRKLAESALSESEHRLRELMQVQKRFMADAAHELRTPLTAIQGNLDILMRYDNIPEPDRKEILSDVQREAIRLGRLVHDMLTLARGDAGIEFQEEQVDLTEVIEEVCRETDRVQQTHQLVLHHLPEVQLLGDRDRLKQLLLILLENALKYTPTGGQIEVSLKQPADYLEVRVQDNGPGIARQDLERVFERFYRADQSRHRGVDPGGTGLGLPIARWIVEGHGGHIWLESELGKGTTAVVQLPIREPHDV
ncbi:PAS domain-containing sensor histidine kinase [Deinococcus misasensis]|uniref:PAS domain-containing sensor histidine kinase n=1 Tax=Deinococcus misasensis TaxID=392413 RepID=UPI00055216EA|nr:PAS domain-containing sensor histidine kinase [Deinococcus misasensis]